MDFLTSALALSCLAFADPSNGPAQNAQPRNNPDACVDLRTLDGAALVNATWRVHDVELAPIAFRAVGADLKPSGPENSTFEPTPHAHTPGFDDSAWRELPADQLETRLGDGRTSFVWYRLHVRMPQTLGTVAVDGAVVVLELVVDDLAEIWVDGALRPTLGQTGGAVAAGWNAVQRVVLSNSAHVGQEFTVAVFAANAPLSHPPENYVWMRSATLDVYRPERWRRAEFVEFTTRVADPAFTAVVAPEATLERLATGFGFCEGPVVLDTGDVLFSDPNRNVVQRWSADEGVAVYRTKSGYSGVDLGRYRQPGSNGLALDREGRLTLCEHGNRRVTRLERNGVLTVLADRFDGKRLNSPNDLTYRSDGALFFTDPPFGLPGLHDDPARELDFCGVYCLKDGVLSLVSKEFSGPNGIAFSPDERFLYVANWDTGSKQIRRFRIETDGSATSSDVFFDFTKDFPGEEALDGLEVDHAGNVFVSGPGGVHVLAASGLHLGTIVTPELPANFAWEDAGRTRLVLAARTGLYRLTLRGRGSLKTGVRAGR
ncbi:MAG: SMP-30/gluconolactonase/LRE family protein [Planctomycetes bacterium]|nr:SMP-30/gluconolactonase/LRE family protein [Planctomycetota bacterium]